MGKIRGKIGGEKGNVTTRMCVDVNVKGDYYILPGDLTLSRALAFQFLEVRATARMFGIKFSCCQHQRMMSFPPRGSRNPTLKRSPLADTLPGTYSPFEWGKERHFL